MRRILALAVTSAALLAGCGSDPEPQTLGVPPAPSRLPSVVPSVIQPSAAQPSAAQPSVAKAQPGAAVPKPQRTVPAPVRTTKPPVKKPVLPADLLGAWQTVTENGNAFSYELYADGKYAYNGIMQVDGLRYTLQEGGRAAVSGDQITFSPQITIMTRTENGESTTTRPQRDPRELSFAVSGNRLTFTESDGSGSVYERG
jgi:hypothetical protein